CIQDVLKRAARAEQARSFLWIDMEESRYVDATLEVYRRAKTEWPNVGVCLQAYLRRTAKDLESLLSLSPAIRLVKGAYNEPAEIAFPRKGDVDENRSEEHTSELQSRRDLVCRLLLEKKKKKKKKKIQN